MAGNKRSSGPDIGSYFDSGVGGNTLPEEEKAPQAKAAVKNRKKMPTSFRIEDGYLEDIKILTWKLVMPTFTATVNRAFREFIGNHRDALEEARAQLGEDGIRELLSKRD